MSAEFFNELTFSKCQHLGSKILIELRLKVTVNNISVMSKLLPERGKETPTPTQICLKWSKFHPANKQNMTGSSFFFCFVALRPKSIAMVIAGRSVHLTTLFSWASLNKQLTSNRAYTIACNWQQPFMNDSAEGRRMTVETISWSISTKVWDRAGKELATSGSGCLLMLRFADESGNNGVWLLCNINTKNCESNIAIEETSVSCRILMSFLYNLNNLPDPREAYCNDSQWFIAPVTLVLPLIFTYIWLCLNIFLWLRQIKLQDCSSMTLSEHSSLTLFFYEQSSLTLSEWLCQKTIGVCLFDLILYVPSTIFQLNRDGSSWVEPVLS